MKRRIAKKVMRARDSQSVALELGVDFMPATHKASTLLAAYLKMVRLDRIPDWTPRTERLLRETFSKLPELANLFRDELAPAQ